MIGYTEAQKLHKRFMWASFKQNWKSAERCLAEVAPPHRSWWSVALTMVPCQLIDSVHIHSSVALAASR